MFVVIYTSGPAWQSGKRVTEQPLFREHLQYMQQVFAARQLLMGVLFWTLRAPWPSSMSPPKCRRGTSSHTIPGCRRGC